MNPQFDNMIQVLTYFANQCNMFTPMLEGVKALKEENTNLQKQIEEKTITQNRLQLNSTFSADYANFGVAVNAVAYAVNSQENKDLYNLIKAVIEVGKDNYNRDTVEYMLDFYSMVDKLSFEDYEELWTLMDSQTAEMLPSLGEDEQLTTEEDTEQSQVLPEDTVQEDTATVLSEVVEEEKQTSSFFSRLAKKK